ncbi:alpha/beta fold hydrolase [Leifsonia sp. NPDC077715]|uniref:alpha/beta hydrolase family protein n=1 Tax=Leifsonia sp. NPDC077715 TaxID=3155539 RepID=UPI00343A3ED8
MGWIIIAVIVAACAVSVWVAHRAGLRLAHRVVHPRYRPATRIRACTASSVTLDADRRTLHRGQFGLWFGAEGHAVVGPIRGRDHAAGTVTRELLHVSGDLADAELGYWTGQLHAGPEALRRPFREVEVAVAGGTAPAWLIPPERARRPATWAIHIHGWGTTRITALRSVPATEALGMTSLVVSFRGDGEAREVAGGVSTLGMTEWEDVDAAIGYARDHGAERVVLVGWSLGGTIALRLCERSAHRNLIERLILIGPVTDWRTAIRSTAADRGVPWWTAALAIRTLADRRASARMGLPGPIDFDRLSWGRPGRLTVPTLVIHSDGDRQVPLASSVLFAMANPDLVRLVELSPAEHGWEYNVDPAAFNRAIIEFVEPG